jgi:hypothetical protein
MKVETQDDQERNCRDLLSLSLCWLGLVAMLYLLSSGAYVMIVDKKLMRPNRTVNMVVASLYGPLDWIYRKTPLRTPLGIYWHLWAPGIFDKHGNPNSEGAGP